MPLLWEILRTSAVLVTYKYRLKDRRARNRLRAHAFALNQVWNWCVAQHRDLEVRYRAGAPKRKWASAYDLKMMCSGAGKLLRVNQQSVQEVCHRFAVTRDKLKRSPKFRASSGSRRALGWIPFQAQSRQISGNTVTYLRKTYRFWEGRRPLPVLVKGGAFVEDALGRWYVCFHVEVDYQNPVDDRSIGIDLGLKALAVCSDGSRIAAPQHFRQHAQKLATAQRAGNKRRVKAIHAKIANCRRDHLHKASTQLARENALIVVGDVNPNWLAKTRAAKSVLDAGWSAFRNMLRYKASRHGACYLEVDEAFTTVTCSSCLSRSGPEGQKGLRIREWVCSDCGASHDRDVNAARNILALGLSAQPRADESRPCKEGCPMGGNRISTTRLGGAFGHRPLIISGAG